MTVGQIHMSDALHAYLLSVSLREPEVLRRLREETRGHPKESMQTSPEQGQFMALLVQLMGAKRVLEVGVFTGYSSTAMALALPAEGRLVALDASAEWTEVARRWWEEAGVAGKVELRLGPAAETMDALLAEGRGGGFDLCYIDADKQGYPDYYERALRLVHAGGLILIDNTLYGGRLIGEGGGEMDEERAESARAIRAFNRMVHGDARVAISMLPLADGLTLALKR